MDANVTQEGGDGATVAGTPALRQFGALCQIGLPLRPGQGGWRRDVGSVALTIEPPEGGALPYGAALRLLLLHVFSAALASGSAVVEVGDTQEALAARIGVADAAALGEQWRLATAARLTLSLGGGAGFGVFDARGRRAAGDWRASVRLSARCLAALEAGAVGLDRAVVAALAGQPLALDAYMWLAARLAAGPEPGAAEPVGANWDELYGRFGDQGQTPETFRTAFEAALCDVTVACPTISVIMGDAGVQPRAASPARPGIARPPAGEPAAPSAAPAPSASGPAASGPAASAPSAPPPSASAEAQPVLAPRVAAPAEPRERPGERPGEPISLRSHMTGLAQVVWLHRAHGRENQVIEVTPGGRYDPDSVTVLALEPLVVQISGGLYEREFERVSAWAMSNRDLIDDVWDGKIANLDEIARRVKKVPAPGWR